MTVKHFKIGDLVVVPKREWSKRFEVTKDYEFAIIMQETPFFDTSKLNDIPPDVELYLQETGSFAKYQINEIVKVK